MSKGSAAIHQNKYSKFQGYQVKVECNFGFLKNYEIHGVNPRSESRQRTSIIVSQRGPSEDQYYIFVRGDQVAMRGVLQLDAQEQTNFRNLMVQYKELMLNRVIYAFRRLTPEEVEIYLNGYNLMVQSKRVDNFGINRLAKPLEVNLKFLGCLGIKTTINKDAQDLINSLRQADIPISVMSGDS